MIHTGVVLGYFCLFFFSRFLLQLDTFIYAHLEIKFILFVHKIIFLKQYFFGVTVAGEAFCRAAELQLALGSKHEGATYYVDAGNCYKKGDANGQENCFLFFFHFCGKHFCRITSDIMSENF